MRHDPAPPPFLPPGKHAEPDWLNAVNVLFDQMIRDHKLVLAIRASERPACRTVGDWLAASDFEPKVLPVPASEFYWTLSRAINIACLDNDALRKPEREGAMRGYTREMCRAQPRPLTHKWQGYGDR